VNKAVDTLDPWIIHTDSPGSKSGLQPVKPSPIQIVAAVVLGQKVEQLDIMPPQIPLPGDSHATLKIRWDRTCRDFANAIMLLRFAFLWI